MKKLIVILTIAILGSVSLSAQTVQQNKRIQNGVVTGELTKKETRQLKRQQKKLKRIKRKAMKDGVVSPKEQSKIAKQEAKLNRNIYRQKHDRQVQIGR